MMCEKLHKFFNGLVRYGFPFHESDIPANGIYILFEKGERAHNCDRIVRVGTHTGQGNLRQRLAEHFFVENKDRSILRKNIGRAILNQRNDPFLVQWEMDLTTKQERQRSATKIDRRRLSLIEKGVSRVIRKKFTFCVLPLDSQQHRLDFEERIIATINHCPDCCPSDHWLGKHSTKAQIRNSGLWLVQGLNGNEVKAKDLAFLKLQMKKMPKNYFYHITPDFKSWQRIEREGLSASPDGYIYVLTRNEIAGTVAQNQLGIMDTFFLMRIDPKGVTGAVEHDNVAESTASYQRRIRQDLIESQYIRLVNLCKVIENPIFAQLRKQGVIK